MAIIYSFKSLMFGYLIGLTSCLNVRINIEPKSIKVGDNLMITCIITDDAIDKEFKTYLRCPFHDKEMICITNCESQDICSEAFCDRKMVGSQRFQCYLSETITSLRYSYQFMSISNSVVKNRNRLNFTCMFKGVMASDFVRISSEINNNEPKNSIATTTTASLPNVIAKSSSPKTINIIEPGTLRYRDFIIIGLIGGLIVSFLLNVWCTVQWCVRKCRKKNRNKNYNVNMESCNLYGMEESTQMNCNVPIQMAYKDNIQRSSSHPGMVFTNHRNTMGYISNQSIQSNPGSINYKPKMRNSPQIFEDYDMNHESNPSLVNPMLGPMVIAPIQCFDQSLLSYVSPMPQYYNQSVHLNTESNMSQNNLDTVSEQDISERHSNSVFLESTKRSEESASDINSAN